MHSPHKKLLLIIHTPRHNRCSCKTRKKKLFSIRLAMSRRCTLNATHSLSHLYTIYMLTYILVTVWWWYMCVCVQRIFNYNLISVYTTSSWKWREFILFYIATHIWIHVACKVCERLFLNIYTCMYGNISTWMYEHGKPTTGSASIMRPSQQPHMDNMFSNGVCVILFIRIHTHMKQHTRCVRCYG